MPRRYIFSLVLGLILILLVGCAVQRAIPTSQPVSAEAISTKPAGKPSATPQLIKASATPMPAQTRGISQPTSEPTSTSVPTPMAIPSSTSLTPAVITPQLEPAAPVASDLPDMALLYNSRAVTAGDLDIQRLAAYYGIQIRAIALDRATLSKSLLSDPTGRPYPLIAISGQALTTPGLLSTQELDMLGRVAGEQGSHILIYKLNEGHHGASLLTLTGGAIIAVQKRADAHRDWHISDTAPEICREFSGQTVSYSPDPQLDRALVLAARDDVRVLISSTDDRGATYPILVQIPLGKGSVFAESGEEVSYLEGAQERCYYCDDNFSRLVPLMMVIRYALGDEVWHRDLNYANLTIDDPSLVEPYLYLSYPGLLQEMEKHDFHTTIALIPANWRETEPEVVRLFREHPDRFSLVQHGNESDGYEFYYYGLGGSVITPTLAFPPHPLNEQEVDIDQGLRRMQALERDTGLSFDRIMVFPWGIAPEPTLCLLKARNYLATVNGRFEPLGSPNLNTWDAGMYPAEMRYASFPVLQFRHPATYAPFELDLEPFLFDLFVDRPALFHAYVHEGQLFSRGIDAFSPIADQVNAWWGDVQWASLGEIVWHLYWQKRNDDGSIAVRLFSPRVLLENDSDDMIVYHISKQESLNVAIENVLVNGHEFPYSVIGGMLYLDVQVPPHTPFEVMVCYGR